MALINQIRDLHFTKDDIRQSVDNFVDELSESIREIADRLLAKNVIPQDIWKDVTLSSNNKFQKVRLVLNSILEDTDDGGLESSRKIILFLESVLTTNDYVVKEVVDKKQQNLRSVSTEAKDVRMPDRSNNNAVLTTVQDHTCNKMPQQPVENTDVFDFDQCMEDALVMKRVHCDLSCSSIDTDRKHIDSCDEGQNSTGDRSFDETSWPGSDAVTSNASIMHSDFQSLSIQGRDLSASREIPRPVPPVAHLDVESNTVALRRLCKAVENLQDNFAWEECESRMQRLKKNRNNLPILNTMECKVALLILDIRKQCYLKKIRRGTIFKDCDNLLSLVKSSDEASFLEVKILAMKAWASWLIGYEDVASDCFEGAMNKTQMLRSGEEKGLFHYQLAFYLRYKYTKLPEFERKLMGGGYLCQILRHYNEAVKAFEDANNQLDNCCTALLILAHLSLAQTLLRTGVTAAYDKWDTSSISDSDKNTAETHLKVIYNDLWNHVQSFPKLCYLTAECDLLYLKGEYVKASESLEQAQQILRLNDFGLLSIESALSKREDKMREIILEEHNRINNGGYWDEI